MRGAGVATPLAAAVRWKRFISIVDAYAWSTIRLGRSHRLCRICERPYTSMPHMRVTMSALAQLGASTTQHYARRGCVEEGWGGTCAHLPNLKHLPNMEHLEAPRIHGHDRHSVYAAERAPRVAVTT